MKLQKAHLPGLEWLKSTLSFFKTHFPTIFALGFLAGIGRIIQLKGFGPVSPTLFILTEIVVEGARIVLFLYILGSASMKLGAIRVKSFITDRQLRKDLLRKTGQSLKNQWQNMMTSLLAYSLIALAINKLIDLLAYETCFYLTMQQHGILSGDSSEWTMILFFKNLTVIPLTLVFNAILIFYLTGKLAKARK